MSTQKNNNGTENPEALHMVGSGTDMKTTSAFDNSSTAPKLVDESEMPSAMTSKSGTNTLRSNLIKE